ncbi:MAG: polyhydroxyalkanoate synthesis repressor PhaR [Pseudomonadota bacterium]
MSETTSGDDTIVIKRYASRRLYNTQTSDYVTLDQVSDMIREGKTVQIVDRKTGEDLTRQYLLQIIAEQESRGETILPVDVLNDIIRSYSDQAASLIPDFLSNSFGMLKAQQEAFLENASQPMAELSKGFDPASLMNSVPGFEAMQQQQNEIMKNMMAAWVPPGMEGMFGGGGAESPARAESEEKSSDDTEELAQIKAQLAALQDKLSKL